MLRLSVAQAEAQVEKWRHHGTPERRRGRGRERERESDVAVFHDGSDDSEEATPSYDCVRSSSTAVDLAAVM